MGLISLFATKASLSAFLLLPKAGSSNSFFCIWSYSTDRLDHTYHFSLWNYFPIQLCHLNRRFSLFHCSYPDEPVWWQLPKTHVPKSTRHRTRTWTWVDLVWDANSMAEPRVSTKSHLYAAELDTWETFEVCWGQSWHSKWPISDLILAKRHMHRVQPASHWERVLSVLRNSRISFILQLSHPHVLQVIVQTSFPLLKVCNLNNVMDFRKGNWSHLNLAMLSRKYFEVGNSSFGWTILLCWKTNILSETSKYNSLQT